MEIKFNLSDMEFNQILDSIEIARQFYFNESYSKASLEDEQVCRAMIGECDSLGRLAQKIFNQYFENLKRQP